jgi:xylose isomerase
LILKGKAARWNADKEIQAILHEISGENNGSFQTGRYSRQSAAALLAQVFDKDAICKKRLPYERLDQLTVDVLAGLR